MTKFEEKLLAENQALQKKIKDLKAKLMIAEANATTDSLTKLPNRRFMEIELEQQLAVVRRGSSMAVAMIDLDYFKKINDTEGHTQGDLVLKLFAKAILKAKRETDLLGRWGGEEFLMILPLRKKTSQDRVEVILNRFHEAVSQISRRKPKQPFEPLTISIGCVMINKKSAPSTNEVIKAIDTNLYFSKEHGRNRSTVTKLS